MRENAQKNTVEKGEVQLLNADGHGNLIFVCEHASNYVPDEFADLGLDADALRSHIAWDPGAWAVARHLSAAFDAPLVAPGVSRLVYDCNRPAQAQSAIPQKSEIYDIPGNIGLNDADRQARAERFYGPYRQALSAVVDGALAAGRQPAFVTIHSFTPVYNGTRRTLDLGILHDSDARLADQLIRACAADGDLVARSNEPYGPKDGVTYTLSEHATRHGLLNAMIEIRNDLIGDDDAHHKMAVCLEKYLRTALASLDASQHVTEAV